MVTTIISLYLMQPYFNVIFLIKSIIETYAMNMISNGFYELFVNIYGCHIQYSY